MLSVFSLEWHKANTWMKDNSRFLRQLSFHVFVHFMLLNFNQNNFVRFLLLIPCIIVFLKDFSYLILIK